MYKIYLGSHCFLIASKKSFEGKYDRRLKKPKGDEIIQVCEELLLDKQGAQTILLQGKKKKTRKRVLESFKEVVAGGGAVYNNKKELLLIKRHGKWDLPKGKLELDETIELCAVREVEEECNVFGLELRHLIDITYHFYKTKSGWKIKKAYWYKMDCKDYKQAAPQKEEGIEEIKWVDPKQLDVENLNTFGSIREVLRQL
jgi:8-oxo-dGTP pyrophosphatase MutT (NUDIX family)